MTTPTTRPIRIDHDPGEGYTYRVNGVPVDPPITRVEFVPGAGSTYYVGDQVVDLGTYLAATLAAIAGRPADEAPRQRADAAPWSPERQATAHAATAAREVARAQRVRDALIRGTTPPCDIAISRNALAKLMNLRRQEVYRLCKILLDDPTSGVHPITDVPKAPLTVAGTHRRLPWPASAPGGTDAAPPPPPADSGQLSASWPTPEHPHPLEPLSRPPYVGPDVTGRVAEVPGPEPLRPPAPLPYLGPSAPLHPDLARILGRLS